MINSVKGLPKVQQYKVSLATLGFVPGQLFNELYKLSLARPLLPETMLQVIQYLKALLVFGQA